MNKLHALFDKLKVKATERSNATHNQGISLSEEDEGEVFTVSFSDMSPLPFNTTARYERRKREREIMLKYKLYTEDEYGNHSGRLRITEYNSL